MTLTERRDPTLDTALEALTDTRLTVEDRAGAYALIYAIQLRLNRALRKVKDELIIYMTTTDTRSLGPLSIKSTPVDVTWPCNDEGNWGDDTVQGTFRDVILPIAPEFVRLIPEHYELRTAELGRRVHLGDPVALKLHRMMKERGWRKEAGRNLSIQVKEVKP